MSRNWRPITGMATKCNKCFREIRGGNKLSPCSTWVFMLISIWLRSHLPSYPMLGACAAWRFGGLSVLASAGNNWTPTDAHSESATVDGFMADWRTDFDDNRTACVTHWRIGFCPERSFKPPWPTPETLCRLANIPKMAWSDSHRQPIGAQSILTTVGQHTLLLANIPRSQLAEIVDFGSDPRLAGNYIGVSPNLLKELPTWPRRRSRH